MKKNKKLYYYEYDENKEILKVTEGVYQETKNKLLILDNIYIPKSMVHTNKNFSEFNCKIINKKLSRIKGDKFLYAMPFVTGIYRNIYHKFFKIAFTFISKNLRLYFLGTLKLPFIPFIRYFENRKEMSNIKIKIRLFEKSAEHYKKLSEAQMPQNEKDLYKTLGGISFDDIKNKYKKEYQQLQSELQKLKSEKDNIKNKETDLSNMTFSLIISFSSLLVAVIALILTCRLSKENYKSETVQNYNTETTEEIKTSEKFDKLPDEEIDNSIIYDLEIKNDFTKPIIEAKSGIKKDNVPVFKEYFENLCRETNSILISSDTIEIKCSIIIELFTPLYTSIEKAVEKSWEIRYFERIKLSHASPHGQGIVAAPKAYFAKQSMERERRGTAQSPVFAIGKNGPIKIVLPNIMTVCICS